MGLLFVASLVALASAEVPINSYGVPSAQYQSLPSNNHRVPGASYSGIPSQSYGARLGYDRSSGIKNGPYEFQSNLELENEGANLPNNIVGQDILKRVIYVLSQDLAQQAASQSSANGAPVYGPPPGQDGTEVPPGAFAAPSSYSGPAAINPGGTVTFDSDELNGFS